MEATMAPIGEMSAEELAGLVRERDEAHAARAAQELQRRAGDGEEDAEEALAGLAAEKGARLSTPEEVERGAALEAEQEALDAGADIDAPDAPPAEEASYEQRLAEARAEESALPTAADDDGPPESDPMAVAGDGTQLTFSGFAKAVGGKKPSSSKVRLTGGAFEVPDGAYAKGSTVIFEVKARIGGVAFDDQVDSKTQQVVDCVRSHKARIVGAVRVDADTSGRLDRLHEVAQAYLLGSASENELRVLLGMPTIADEAPAGE